MLLIAYFHVFKRERFGMATGSPHLAPFGIDRTDSIFNSIQHIIHHWLQGVLGNKSAAAVFTGYAGIEHIQCIGAKVFAKLKVFMITKPITRPVTPYTISAWPFSTGPNVRFQLAALSILMPSTKHPPGQRTKAGFRSARYCARSRRMPLGRPLKVCRGKRDTKSSQTVPVLPKLITNFALRSDPIGFSVQVYFFQLIPFILANTCLASTFPSASCRDTVSGPA